MKALVEETIATGIPSEVSIKNILYATDFSAASEAALPYVAGLSRLYGSTIHIVHALPKTNFVRPGSPDSELIGSIYQDAYSEAQKNIQLLAQHLKPFPYKTYVRHGEVTDVLAEIIRDQNPDQKIDLLVAGTHGRTGVGKLLMGSVAEQILRQVSVPMLTVGPKAAPRNLSPGRVPSGKVKFGRILFATSFAEDSSAAAFAISLAEQFHSHLTLLHVIENYGPDLHDHPGPIEGAFTKLAAIATQRAHPHCRPEPAVQFGPAADVILRTAEESRAGLIVLGAHAPGAHTPGNHVPGTTVHKVSAHATCPVLTVHG